MASNLVLCVVDMQEDFSASSNPKTIRACRKEIKRAIERKAPIVFLEWGDCGDTLESLLKLVKNYPRYYIATKYQDDGSYELIEELKANYISPKRSKYRVCGVNTDACVWKTIKGLRDKLPNVKIEVATKACNTNWSQSNGILQISKVPKVKLLDVKP